MKSVSVIVPVYNTSEYLPECLDSLISQSLQDIEIVCVNDGSTDRSPEILKDYADKYPDRIKLINQENAGLSEARNAGIAASTGEYLGFVDSDDFVSPDMFRLLYEKAVSRGFDMAVCDIAYVFRDKTKTVSSNIPSDALDACAVRETMPGVYPTVWNKLFKRELFETGIRFKKGIWYEDFEFLYRLYPHIQSIGTVRMPLYFYRQRPGGITGVYDDRLYQFITNFNGIIGYYRENGFYPEYRDELEYLYVRYAFATMIKRLARTNDRKLFKEGVCFAISQVRNNFPDYKKNPIFKKQGLKGRYLLYFNRLCADLVRIKEKLLPGV